MTDPDPDLDPVRLYIDSDRQSGCPVPPYIDIIPAVATQIVTLTDLPARLAALEDHAHRVLDLNRRHLRGLIPIAAARGEVEAECDRMGLPPLAVAGITGGSVGAQPAGGSALEARPSPGDDGMAVHSFTREGFEHQRKCIVTLRAEIAAGVPAARALIVERDRLGAQVASLVGPDGRNYCAQVESERDKALADLKAAKLDVIRAVAEWAGTNAGNYREMVAARADADARRKEVAELKERNVTWTPETRRQVIARTTALVELIERRDGPDGVVTMSLLDVVILRDLARASGLEVAE